MVALTRAQAKRAAAAASTSTTAKATTAAADSQTPTRKLGTRNHVISSRTKTSGTPGAGSSQCPTKQGPLASKKRTSRRPATPAFTAVESSTEPIQHSTTLESESTTHIPIPTETHPFAKPDDAEPFGPEIGWVRIGNSLRRESVLPEGVMSQIQAQQQAKLTHLADEAYKEQTTEMMQQHNLTYQWYDRMMTEGLQNSQGSNSSVMVMGDTSDTVMKDDHDLVGGFNGNSSEMDCEMEIPCYLAIESDTAEASSSDDTMSGAESDCSNVLLLEKKQLQPCPPGVRYSLFSTPTEIIPQY
ncbi:hypothetical protein F5051DRAFT_413359 [Lentinula edodes]|nr:hypothetical protein F5051DRAFT_413359 [Lentinula edodes]